MKMAIGPFSDGSEGTEFVVWTGELTNFRSIHIDLDEDLTGYEDDIE